jgi:hypothetical protein
MIGRTLLTALVIAAFSLGGYAPFRRNEIIVRIR